MRGRGVVVVFSGWVTVVGLGNGIAVVCTSRLITVPSPSWPTHENNFKKI